MKWFRLRPTFEIPVHESSQAAIEKLVAISQQRNQPTIFRVHGEYGELHLPTPEHRVWSPHLSFYITQRGDSQLLLGRFAPRVDVWTSVWIFYLLMAFSSFFGFMLAYSQWSLGHPTWGLWLGGVPLLAIATLYIVAHIGQQWSVDQMHALRDQLEQILSEASIATVATQRDEESRSRS